VAGLLSPQRRALTRSMPGLLRGWLRPLKTEVRQDWLDCENVKNRSFIGTIEHRGVCKGWVQFFQDKGGAMKTIILRLSIATAVVMCATVLLAKEPRNGSGNAGGGRSAAQGIGPDQGRIDVRANTEPRNNVDALRRDNQPSSQGNINARGNGILERERQRTDCVGHENNWRYRQNGNVWWYWGADNRWLYWQNDRWVGLSSDSSQDENAWRYRWHDVRWWYWTTSNRWLYWDDNQWVATSG
jgi:hypothetical protein